jgi:hypothetical protein
MSTQYRLVQSGKTASGGCSAGQGSSEHKRHGLLQQKNKSHFTDKWQKRIILDTHHTMRQSFVPYLPENIKRLTASLASTAEGRAEGSRGW